MKRLIIEQLKEGFIFLDEVGEKYAVSSAGISIKVKAYFGLTDCSKRKKIKNNIAPPAMVSDPKETRTQGNKTADSQSSSTEHAQKHPANVLLQNEHRQTGISPNTESKLGTPDNMVQRGQCAELLGKLGFDSPAAPFLRPSDLKVAAFDYDEDNNKTRQYKSLFFTEFPDGRVVLVYAHSKYYTSKDAVLQIPYPFPKGYFSKENGWSSSVETAFKMYRRYLAEQKEPEGQPDGTCDDIAFETCANNDPKICKFCVNESRYEDKRKIAARKPGAPLLKASMGV